MLFNVIFVLVYTINKIAIGKHEIKNIVLILPNTLMLVLILLTVIAWWFGAVESRDDRIGREASTTISATWTIPPAKDKLLSDLICLSP